jgi:hypothetical protein
MERTNMSSSKSCSWLIFATYALATSLAHAEQGGAHKVLASQLFDDGQSFLEQGKADEACPKFAESARLDPQLGTLFFLAECYDQIGKTASTWATFREATEIAVQRGDARATDARARVAELEPRLSKLTIALAPGLPADIEIRQDGDPVSRVVLGTAVPIDPGEHTIVAHAAGFRDWSRTIDVAPGASVTSVTVPSLEPNAPAVPASASSTTQTAVPRPQTALRAQATKDSSGSVGRTLGYLATAIGLAGVGVGGAFAALMSSKASERDDVNKCSAGKGCTDAEAAKIQQLTGDARTDAKVANVCFAAGGVAVVGGMVLLLTSHSEQRQAEGTAVTLDPWIGPNLVGLGVGGSL